ncbi:MAG: PaaI family thioesterase [Epsilonproteobacteria bacterium]|nr:PaaI family thioesterase [Campylobacterota bacterium]PIP10799.1 MAG: thioesterase [Sulfurimonas sp. CG23_combo_of_CG06-09_8_20_14_all_36_33]PIS24260.1 MAG: thioesterase [Sulfurimonas sp. CG08_land_8_20_14_0_20_36_33]PIU36065.1 MAG: thioesterase [Sulfurimonas sp. CG07_land_8_20_14_0_80_36_56]PIV04410.1 MAG: thioesterase [Sulfurimonas sp. CG03_land_8_20_14_0_80_36_25]PIV34391.1 MAG: thioesterase [Sulfurimonas sp. CG02_land_8_20_14_3_00_36_67]PIV61771.1 MAG: thioesterase [Sulfurimonas sp. CG0
MSEEIDDELELNDYREDEKDEVVLKTHEKINRYLNGEILKMENGYVETRLSTSEEMLADDQGLIHGGFIFSAADFAAMVAVNERNVVLVGSECQFLSPVKLRDDVNFVAKVRHKEGRKRNVHVTGHVFHIKVFEGEFKTVITERHVLKLKLLEEEQ